MSRSRRSSLSKTLKDYLVPLIGLGFIMIIIINAMSGDDKERVNVGNENTTPIEVVVGDEDSEAYVVYPGDSKKKIEGSAKLYKGEKILVKEGQVSLSYSSDSDIVLNRLGELKYKDDGDLSLFSSDLWINTTSKLNISMRYVNVNILDGSVVSLSQNEVGSSVYLLSGKVEVTNLAGKKVMLTGGQKITVSREDTSNGDIDLSLQKTDIDNFFKRGDWFIKNSGDLYLGNINNNEETSGTGELYNSNSSSLISITSFKDEDRVESSSIDIKGRYRNSNIFIISVNGENTKINEEEKTFSLTDFNLESSVNDIIIKVYDTDRNLMGKYIYTIYVGDAKANTSGSTGFKVKTFDVDASLFKFTSPTTTGNFTTYNNFVTIKGIVPPKMVSKVVVNDYKLNSFNGTTWRYHARTDYNNLKNGTNVYEIKYYKSDGSLLYTNHFTIIKKVVGKTAKVISDEVKVN